MDMRYATDMNVEEFKRLNKTKKKVKSYAISPEFKRFESYLSRRIKNSSMFDIRDSGRFAHYMNRLTDENMEDHGIFLFMDYNSKNSEMTIRLGIERINNEICYNNAFIYMLRRSLGYRISHMSTDLKKLGVSTGLFKIYDRTIYTKDDLDLVIKIYTLLVDEIKLTASEMHAIVDNVDYGVTVVVEKANEICARDSELFPWGTMEFVLEKHKNLDVLRVTDDEVYIETKELSVPLDTEYRSYMPLGKYVIQYNKMDKELLVRREKGILYDMYLNPFIKADTVTGVCKYEKFDWEDSYICFGDLQNEIMKGLRFGINIPFVMKQILNLLNQPAWESSGPFITWIQIARAINPSLIICEICDSTPCECKKCRCGRKYKSGCDYCGTCNGDCFCNKCEICEESIRGLETRFTCNIFDNAIERISICNKHYIDEDILEKISRDEDTKRFTEIIKELKKDWKEQKEQNKKKEGYWKMIIEKTVEQKGIIKGVDTPEDVAALFEQLNNRSEVQNGNTN